MLGNLLFGLTSLFYIGLIILNFSKPQMTGENAMGYGLGIAFLGIGLAVSSLLLTLKMGNSGCFDWILTPGSTRTLIIGLGWLMMVIATFFCAFLKWEWHGEFPLFIRWLSLLRAEIWLPLLMLIPALLLLNSERPAGTPPAYVHLPMTVGFALSGVICLGLLFGWLKSSSAQQIARIEQIKTENDKQQQEHLKRIADQKAEDPILNILSLTGRFHDEIVRDSAVAKIKSHPDWEAELLRLLDNEHYYTSVYTFIDGNRVTHPELFTEPLNRSILRSAAEIKSRIKDANDLQSWHFEHFNIERLLRAIDEQFNGPGMDFRPAIRTLRAALGTTPPERFKNVRFTVTPVVDAWLKAHP